MTGGVRIKPGQGLVLNGIDIDHAVEVAIGMMRNDRCDLLNVSDDRERAVAEAGCATLRKSRRAGYSRDICRDALWAKVIDEARRLDPATEARLGK